VKNSIENKGKLIFTCGLSGSGKTTLARAALRTFSNLEYLKTYTMRPQRDGEDGLEYSFVDMEKYCNIAHESKKWDESVIYGNYYGTNAEYYIERLDKGGNLIVCAKPDLEIVEPMLEIYGHDKSRIILIEPDNDIAEKRLRRERVAAELSRIAVDLCFNELFYGVVDEIFTPEHNIDIDQQRFNKIVGEMINE
jgi:guanylate kinase